MDEISKRKHINDRDIVKMLRLRTKVLLHMWSYDFHDTTLSTEWQQRHMIKNIPAYDVQAGQNWCLT